MNPREKETLDWRDLTKIYRGKKKNQKCIKEILYKPIHKEPENKILGSCDNDERKEADKVNTNCVTEKGARVDLELHEFELVNKNWN